MAGGRVGQQPPAPCLRLCLALPGLVLGTNVALGRTFSFLINPPWATGSAPQAVPCHSACMARPPGAAPALLELPRWGSSQ